MFPNNSIVATGLVLTGSVNLCKMDFREVAVATGLVLKGSVDVSIRTALLT